MRTLVIVDELPYPVLNGGSIRIHSIVRGLAQLGDVDVFALRPPDGAADIPLPSDGSVCRATVAPRPSYRGRSYSRWVRSELPYELVSVDYSGTRECMRRWMASTYDLIYFRPVTLQLVLGDLVHAPVIVDMDDLKSDLLAATLRNVGSAFGPSSVGGGKLSGWIRGNVWSARMHIDVGRWRRLERKEARVARVVFVASEFHRRRLGAGNAVVVPNAYPPPPSARGVIDTDRTPTISFIGTLTWPPNRDAVERLVTAILPMIRNHFPHTELRLVGSADDGIARWARHPGVTVTGRVRSVDDELSRADLVVVPIRFAGGTRIKILEAFAHFVPVVSSTVGCEGLDVVPNQHLLIADSDEELVAACVRLLSDVALRRDMVRQARELFDSRYSSDQVEGLVSAAASDAMASGRDR